MFSPTCIWIYGTLADYYDKRLLDLSTNLCLFADNEYGDDVVQNQTATIGAVTITDAYGNVTAKYLPMIDGNGTPCLFNPVSGAYIYHRGSGTPVVTYGIKDG